MNLNLTIKTKQKDQLIINFIDENIFNDKINYLENSNELLKVIKDIDFFNFNMEELVNIRNFLFQNQNKFTKNVDLIILIALLEKYFKMNNVALEWLNHILSFDINNIEAIREIGLLFAEIGNNLDALKHFQKIIEIEKNDHAAWNDGACVLRALGDKKASLEWMKESSKYVKKASIFANIGLLEYEVANYEEAQKALDEAFSIDANLAEGLHTQAMLLSSMGRHKEAYEYELKALESKPEYSQARLGLGLIALLLGDYKEGFSGYEYRWVGSDQSHTKTMISINRPWWLGQKVYKSSSIVITAEQGFGDMVQFARFIPLLKKYFHKIFWLVPPELEKLMNNSFQDDNIVILIDSARLDPRKVDFELPLMSLGLALNITLKNLPAKEQYIYAELETIEKWSKKLENIKGLKVGIAWTGNSTLGKHELRSIEAKLLSTIDIPNVNFFSLQKFSKNEMIELPSFNNFYNFMEDCSDFNETAGLISNLDIVISVDTVIAHLAASLGKKTWLLNRFGSEWRWLDAREDSPWYPTMKIFNQLKLKDWKTVLENVKIELEHEINKI